jgi:hypothetical protein
MSNTRKHRVICVTPATHREVKLQAAQAGLTMGQLVGKWAGAEAKQEDKMGNDNFKTETVNGIDIQIPRHDYTLAQMVGRPDWDLYICANIQGMALTWHTRLEASEGEVSMREHRGHEINYRVSIMSVSDAEGLMRDLVTALKPRMDAYTSEWDGSNHVAKFPGLDEDEYSSDPGQDVVDGFEPGPTGGLWDAADWLFGSDLQVDIDTTNEEIAQMAKSLQAEAHDDGVHLYDVDEYLESLRATAEEDYETELEQALDDAINRSIEMDEIVYADYRDLDQATTILERLSETCEHTQNGDIVECWGTDQGENWRVHLRFVGSVGSAG